jgi:hypothetical protein
MMRDQVQHSGPKQTWFLRKWVELLVHLHLASYLEMNDKLVILSVTTKAFLPAPILIPKLTNNAAG